MSILLASTNPHKLREIRQMIPPRAVRLYSLADLPKGGSLAEPVEDQPTFEGNAALKARYYARHSGELTLADDSGLEVDALGGAPGVRSARYSQTEGLRQAVDLANNALLLKNLAGVAAGDRTARFVCAMVLASPEDEVPLATVRGSVEGRIITEAEAWDADHPERGRGENGFGYDPLFWLPARGCTTAELSPGAKNAISHRGDAARKMWEKLIGLGLAAAEAGDRAGRES